MPATASPYAQHGFRVRFDWGLVGADAIGAGATVVAIVDVLSFTTALNVAVEHGIEVIPYRWRDATAVAFARQRNAVLAVGRSQVSGPGLVSLSAASIRTSTGVRRLVLPSPNGSTIAHHLAGRGATVIGVCLRNAEAAAAWAVRRLSQDSQDDDAVVAVVAAGERWADGSLRPALEDLLGSGAFITGLARRGLGPLSPEAQAAAGAHSQAVDRLPEPLRACASGRELVGNGYSEDVLVAAEVDASRSVPVLTGDVFQAADDEPPWT